MSEEDAALFVVTLALIFLRGVTAAQCAEDVVQLLIRLDAPGCQWLDLAPLEKVA